MWKLVSTLRCLNERYRPHIANVISFGRRYFLSEAYKCEDAWQKRLQAPILQNLNLDELFAALDQKFNRDGKASVIDIDLFANAVRSESYVDELEDVIHKLRLSSNTTKTLSSTHHAVIRYYMDLEQYGTILRILDDRLNYGMFPDDYCLALLLDAFIKQKKITEAARLCSIHMLQEDWSCPLVTSLALYACHLYVQNPVPWPVEVEDDSGEEVLVRVPYIRNPYFDDHFDLRDPQLLIGKTLASIGTTMPDAVGQTYQLIGLGLFKKWEKASLFLQQLQNSGVKPAIFESGVKIFRETYERELNDENDSEGKLRESLENCLTSLNSELVTNEDLHAAVVSKVEETVAKEEQNMIIAQQAVYQEWESDRERLLQEQIEELRRQQRLSAIAQEKQQLIEKEQELFFFDNEEKIDLLLEKQESQQKEREMEETLSGKKKKRREEDDDYIPPEIGRVKA